MRIKLTGPGVKAKADVDRLDAVIKSEEDWFIRTGQYDYRQLGPMETSKFFLYLKENSPVDPQELTLVQVEEIIGGEG